MAIMSGAELSKRIVDMKLQGKKVHSNVFKRLDSLGECEAFTTSASAVFIERDHGVNRLNFYTNDFWDLKEVIEQIKEPLTLDILTRNEKEYQKEISAMGFNLLARMRRLVNSDITSLMTRITPPKINRGGVAHSEDAEYVNRKLWSVFDTRISHLMNDTELRKIIEKGEVLIVKENNKIVTILQRSLDRCQFYINQVINEADSRYIHSLMYTELSNFYESGGRYLYAWVQDTNIASNKFHAKYDMKFDGLYDLVYVKQ